MSLEQAIMVAAVNGGTLSPEVGTSKKYKHWVSVPDTSRCDPCKFNHGHIWLLTEAPYPKPPAHPRCRCTIETMQTITAGTATINGVDGADWTTKHKGTLPDYYVTKEHAEEKGWRRGKWPCNFVPGKMITMGIYHNSNNHLPFAADRVRYEADINYTTGKRNSQRVVWSNDGLVFVSYDHYKTFYEII